MILQEIGSFRKPEYLSSVFHKTFGTPEFKSKAERATIETISLFEKAGIDNIGVGGEMFRWEMYENFAIAMQNIEFYGPVRSFDNRYYKKGSVKGLLNLKYHPLEDELKFLIKQGWENIKIPVTGPYTMMDWSFNEYYRDRAELADSFARVLREEILHLLKIWRENGKTGKLEIQIDEPAATTHPDEMDIVVNSVNRTISNIDGIESSIHVCYSSDYGMLFNVMPDLKVDGYNLEFANRDSLNRGLTDDVRKGYYDVKRFNEMNETLNKKKFLGIGVTDVHIDDLESQELIKDRLEYSMKLMPFPELIKVNPDCGLRTRSRDVAYKKLKNMGEAVKSIRKNL
ncbi:methionine synthase [Caldiplasma sukawensis]